MDSTAHRRSRPRTVTLAVILLALGMTIRFVHIFAGAHVDQPAACIVLALIVSLPYLVIWFISRGKNWARWIFLVVFGLALCSLTASVQRLLAQPVLDIAVYSVQVLLCFIAAAALLSHSSAEWFRELKNDKIG